MRPPFMPLLGLASLLVFALAACTSSGAAGRDRAPSTAVVTNRPGSSAATMSAAPADPTTASASGEPSHPAASKSVVPRFAHIVVVVEENHASSQVIGSTQAPYINSLARSGVELTHSFGIRHPSEPNYLALFSGSTHGISDDSCPHTFGSTNLAHQLLAAGQSFTGYAESLPAAGSKVCTSGSYARKHVPWTDFSDLPANVDQPLSTFPSNFAKLPRVAFVVPNLDDDMHDGTVAQADSWLRTRVGRYISWARTHNSLFILTWDEDDNTPANHIPGVLVGAHIQNRHYTGRVDHYTMLRTIESACGLDGIGVAAHRQPITGIWK